MINAIMDIPMLTPPPDPFCGIQCRVKDITFGVALFCTYFVLWFRIFIVFYRNRIMVQDLSKTVQFVNISALPLLFITGTAIVIKFLVQPGNVFAGCGCMPVFTREEFTRDWIAAVSCTTVFQIVFLFCFLYPLYLHQKKMLSSGFNHLSIIPIVKRAAIAAVVCITSDLINLVSAASYVGPNGSILNPSHTYLAFLAYTVNLLVNLIATILSFANWRDKMFPFGQKLKPVHQAPVKNTDRKKQNAVACQSC